MSKFKGTQGKWFPSHMSVNYTTYHNNMTKIWHPMGDEEQRANALLISGAPEMLEMLIEVSKHHQGGHSEIGHKIKQLIKEATEWKT